MFFFFFFLFIFLDQLFIMAFTQPLVSQAISSQDIQSCYDVRIRVFVHEQNIPLELEIDEYVKLLALVMFPLNWCLFFLSKSA